MNREYVCLAVPHLEAYAGETHTDYIPREEVVRCRDCRHGDPFCDSSSYAGMIDCLHFAQWDYYDDEPGVWPVKPDGFCAWGEGRR